MDGSQVIREGPGANLKDNWFGGVLGGNLRDRAGVRDLTPSHACYHLSSPDNYRDEEKGRSDNTAGRTLALCATNLGAIRVQSLAPHTIP